MSALNEHITIKRPDGYEISSDPVRFDFEMIFAYLSGESYWAKGRSRQRMRTAIDHALCFAIYKEDVQVGFARVLTDFATRAYIGDLFVLGEYRGYGLGKWLMETILNDPRLLDVPSWILHTMDAHGLYEQYGFVKSENPERIMEMWRG